MVMAPCAGSARSSLAAAAAGAARWSCVGAAADWAADCVATGATRPSWLRPPPARRPLFDRRHSSGQTPAQFAFGAHSSPNRAVQALRPQLAARRTEVAGCAHCAPIPPPLLVESRSQLPPGAPQRCCWRHLRNWLPRGVAARHSALRPIYHSPDASARRLRLNKLAKLIPAYASLPAGRPASQLAAASRNAVASETK